MSTVKQEDDEIISKIHKKGNPSFKKISSISVFFLIVKVEKGKPEVFVVNCHSLWERPSLIFLHTYSTGLPSVRGRCHYVTAGLLMLPMLTLIKQFRILKPTVIKTWQH